MSQHVKSLTTLFILLIFIIQGCAHTAIRSGESDVADIIWGKFLKDAKTGKIKKMEKHLYGEILEDFNNQLAEQGTEQMSLLISTTYDAEFEIISKQIQEDLVELLVLRKKDGATAVQTFVFKKIKGKWKLID